mgnify:CR=1 FL=1
MLTKTSNTRVVIASIWAFALLVAAPPLIVSKTQPVIYRNETGLVECTEDWSILYEGGESLGQYYTIAMFVITFVLPVIALIYLYGGIGIIVYKHQLPVGNDNRVTNQNLTQTKIKVRVYGYFAISKLN